MDLIVSGSVDNTIILWRRSDDRYIKMRTLRGHTGDIHSVSITDDSKLIASGSGDKTIKVSSLSSSSSSSSSPSPSLSSLSLSLSLSSLLDMEFKNRGARINPQRT
jgi:WD40 repeat protein